MYEVMSTTAQKLRLSLEGIIERLVSLIHEVPVIYRDDSDSGIVFIAPNFYWQERTAEQTSIQTAIKKDYISFSETVRLIFVSSPNDVISKIDTIDKALLQWIEFSLNWSVKDDADSNERALREQASEFFKILDILDEHKEKNIILIPDTNALLISPDPVSYRKLASASSFTFLLMPTVLSEIDQLKISHRNEDVRNKARKIIAMIKGWRKQGSLPSGVTVDKSIKIRALSIEPNMTKTLSWLDKENPDDRIVASVLEIQSQYPASRVVLVTDDINLQNKAETAMIEYLDIDDS